MEEYLEEEEPRENIGMKNPYALADHIDVKHEKPKKEWKMILLGLDPNFSDLETALRDSLGEDYKGLPENLFEPGYVSPLYRENEGNNAS